MEAMSTAFASFAQTSAAGGQSNLQRFKMHYPPIFTGEGDPMVADHWF